VYPAGNLGPPIGEIIGHFKGNRYKLDPTSSIAHQSRDFGHEAARLTGKDFLDSFALVLVGKLVNENAECDFGLSPEVAIDPQHGDDTETIKPHITI